MNLQILGCCVSSDLSSSADPFYIGNTDLVKSYFKNGLYFNEELLDRVNLDLRRVLHSSNCIVLTACFFRHLALRIEEGVDGIPAILRPSLTVPNTGPRDSSHQVIRQHVKYELGMYKDSLIFLLNCLY